MPARLATILVLVLLASYGLYKAVPLLQGPEIRLTSPLEGQSFPDGYVTIEGTALHTEDLSLDGAPLLIDEKGHFSTILTLPAGSAILSLTARDRFGKSQSMRRTIYVP